MSKAKHVVTGLVAFSNLVEKDTFKGKPTKYGLVLTLSEQEAEKLRALNVQVAEYQPTDEDGAPKGDIQYQRKFSTGYKVVPIDAEGNPCWVENVDEGFELPRGSEVRIWCTTTPNDEYGEIPYLGGVRVLELAEGDAPEEF